MTYSVNINWSNLDYDEIHLFNSIKEANNYLVSKGYIYDSTDVHCDYWFYNQYTFATVTKQEEY